MSTIKFTACGCILELGDEPVPEWVCDHGNFIRSGAGRIPFNGWVGNLNDAPSPPLRVVGEERE